MVNHHTPPRNSNVRSTPGVIVTYELGGLMNIENHSMSHSGVPQWVYDTIGARDPYAFENLQTPPATVLAHRDGMSELWALHKHANTTQSSWWKATDNSTVPAVVFGGDQDVWFHHALKHGRALTANWEDVVPMPPLPDK